MSDEQELVPVEQQTLTFNGKPIMVVRLPDGQAGVVIRFLCENLGLDALGQIQRIQRTEVIADDMVYAQIQTDGGLQRMATLVLRGLAYWLATIDTRRMGRDDPRRADILAYQRNAVDALYAWASTPRAIADAAPTNLVPAEPISQPVRPAQDAPLADWREYHLRMAAVLEWQIDIERWRGSVESRLESLEAITDLIPDILERLGPETLTIEHQRAVQALVKRLHDATGKPFGTIYEELKTAFGAPRYQELHEQDWGKVMHWFQVQIERAQGRP